MELADHCNPERNGLEEEWSGRTPHSTLRSYAPRTLRSDLQHFGSLTAADCLRLALDVSGGLARLHLHGLVHRDIKPGNIIFVNGRAKLADLGLVSTMNERHTFVGTEGYIPPEGPGSPAADLYALGMVLYEAITGYAPECFPKVPPEWFATDAATEPLEFYEVVLKACEGAKERRYPSAEAMQADLALLQSGHSIRRMRAWQRHAKRSRRLAIAAGVAALLAVGSILLGHYRVRVETERSEREGAWRREAEQARSKAEHAEEQARAQLLVALTEQARADVRSGELGQRIRTLNAVRQAATITNNSDLRQAAISALVLPDLRFEREIALPPDTTMAVLDPTFERLAFGRGTNAVEIRAVADGSILSSLPATFAQSADAASWSRDGRYVAITRSAQPLAWKAHVEIWELPSARRVLTLPATRYGACSFHPSLPRLVAAHLDDTVGIWDLETCEEIARPAVIGLVHHVQFSPDGETFLVQHRVGKVWFGSVLEASGGKMRSSTPSIWADGIAWHPQDKFMALAAREGSVYLTDLKTRETSVLGRHKTEARAATFSPDGSFLFTGGEDQQIICWNLATRQAAFSLAARSPKVQFAGTGARCAILTRSGLRLHELVKATACSDLPVALGSTVRRGAFSPNGRWLAAGGTSGLGVWDLSSGGLPVVVPQPEHPTPLFSPDSSELFAFSIDHVNRWRLEGDRSALPRLHPLPAPTAERVFSAQFAGDSLIFGNRFGVRVVSGSDPTSPGEFFKMGVNNLSASPGKEWVAVEETVGLEVYRLKPWTSAFYFNTESRILTHTFTPEGKQLAIATPSGLTFLQTNDWKVSGQLPVALDRHARLLFAPDGRTFWLAHDARTAALYDANSLELLVTLPPDVLPLAISPDGNTMLVTIDSHRLQLWNWTMLRRDLEAMGLSWSR